MRPTLAAHVAAAGRLERARKAMQERLDTVRYVYAHGEEPDEAAVRALLVAIQAEALARVACAQARDEDTAS